MAVSHFSLRLAPSFPFDVAKVVRADTHVHEGGRHVFFREGEEVFGVDAHYVHTVTPHVTQRSAEQDARCHREARAGAGAASGHIQELGSAPRTHPRVNGKGSRGAVAEAFSVRVKESG